MGEVYRALDTKLGRDVALKVIRTEFANDADRLSRFQREARVLASFNHPNIGQIYGLEDSAGTPCLVLELVEGDTLDERLKRGPIALEEALDISRQIAEGIAAAHQSGVLHRDLKPANIKLTAGGIVKVLDFGLGKILEPIRPTSDLSQSPTLLSGATQPNVLVGTIAYMSPEQVRGKPADERSDIWAFGCVLFELLSRKPAFGADSPADTIGAITKTDPDWSVLPASVPPSIRRLLRRCLQKDPTRRLQHIGDARIEIEETLSRPEVESGDAIPPSRSPASWIAGAVVGLVLGGALVGAGIYFRGVPKSASKMRLEISLPEQSGLISISPDGRLLVFESKDQGKPQLWVRPLDAAEARPLPGTEGGLFPFWSPDSRFLAFFANGKLKRIEVAGGPAQVFADASNARGGAWNSDGTIIFNAASSGPLSRVSLSGGPMAAATELQKDQGSHRYPQFLPDGRHFLYFALGKPDVSGVYVGSLDGLESKRILASDSQAVYAYPGYLLFLRQGILLAQRFDPRKLELSGDPLPQAEHVATTFTGLMVVSAADNGTVAFGTSVGNDSRLTWFDRSGNQAGVLGPVGDWYSAELSPDDTRVVSEKTENGNVDIWMIEVARGIATRLTSDPADDESPVWAPNGTQIAFDSNRKGPFNLYQMGVRDVGKERPLVETSQTKVPLAWSPDGRYFLFGITETKTGKDLWAQPLFGEGKAFPFAQQEFDQLTAAFSPDARWVVYESNESGQPEVYIQAFPESGEKFRISLEGGGDPRWSANGK
jgi:eukaryotic-like serine/threonine-protein kinase